MNNKLFIIPIFIFFVLVSTVSAAATTDGDFPWIRIDGLRDHKVGENFTISGTTNLPVDEDLIFELVSTSYPQDGESHSGEYTGVSQLIWVAEGDSNNIWSVDIETSTFKPDEYAITVEAVGFDSTAAATIDILGDGTTATAVRTEISTKTATATATPAATTASTTSTQAPPATTSTAAPGFGVIVALIALGTAAVIFLRKE